LYQAAVLGWDWELQTMNDSGMIDIGAKVANLI
jgi:hypothetical protein